MIESGTRSRLITVDNHTLLIDGQRELILSEAIHYSRVPEELWASCIARARRGGKNCIETAIPWSFHEQQPGVWNWQSERKLDVFLAKCERQGMHVIVHAGPYLGAGWDFGGFPHWLVTVPGIALQTMNRPFREAVSRYLDAVTPILVRHQGTRGGSILLVIAQENRTEPGSPDAEYQEWLSEALRSRGVDVPLCLPDTVLRRSLPQTESAKEVEYALWRHWAGGAAFCRHVADSGDTDGPISQMSRRTDEWRVLRRVARFVETFRDILRNGAHAPDLPGRGRNGLHVSATRTDQQGGIVWVDNPDPEQRVTGSVAPYLPEITLAPRHLFPYVHDAPVGGGTATTKYLHSYVGLVKSDAFVLAAHIRPDPYEGARIYVYGDPGETREVVLFHGSGRGEAVEVRFDRAAPLVYPVGSSQVVALSPQMADRVWFPPDESGLAPVLIGPDDVREQSETEAVVEVPPGRTYTLFSLRADGALTEISVDAPALPAPPTLNVWERQAEPDYTASDFDDSDWIEIGEPTSLLALGNVSHRYGWYRATVTIPDATDAELHFAAFSDRLTLWRNGERIGSFSPPHNDCRQDREARFDLRLQSGKNTLCVLVENMGLAVSERLPQKGIYGPATLIPSGGCYLIDITRWRFKSGLYGARQGWQHGEPIVSASRFESEGPIVWYRTSFSLDAPLDTATPLHFRRDGMRKGILWLNGRFLGPYGQPDAGSDFYLPEPYLRVGENTLVLAETDGGTPETASLVWDELASAVVRIAL